MRWFGLLSCVSALLAALTSCAQEPPPPPDWEPKTEASTWDFESDTPGALPAGWRLGTTNPGDGEAEWAVVESTDPNAPGKAFAVTSSTNTGQAYNVAVAEDSVYDHVDLSVRVRADAGEEDQGGGPIWRCIDPNNYYICRFNPLEENFRVYKVINGKRTQLESTPEFTGAGEWVTIRVRMVGDAIECYIDGVLALEATDETLPGPGKIGLWTKADAATSFDDLTAAPAQ